MVAVIAGNGLGLGNTSLTQLGQGLGSQATIGQGNVAQVVNSATGNLVLQTQDEGLVFDGLSLNVLRTYNSQGQLTGSAGWQFGFSRSIGGLTGTLDTVGSTVTRTADDGSAVVYVYNATLGAYVSSDQSGAADTLSWSATASSWTWNDAAASQSETYNASGQLTALSDTQTGASYSFSYTSNNQLSQIVAGDGDTLVFGYNTANQLISLSIQEVPPGQTTAVTRQQVSYAYDSQGRLSTVTTLLASDTDSSTASYTTTYTYSGSSDRVASVSQTDGTTVSYSYTEDAQGVYQVTGITTGTGAAAQVLTLSYGTDSTTVTNALGNATTYNYNAAGELTAVIAPTVNGITPTTRYTYDANGNLLTSTDANGAVTSYSYDANGNLLSVEDGAGNTVSYTYNADDQVLSQTTYTVPAQGEVGQPGYVPPSGAQTTYDVYNAADQLAYVIDALGNVTQNTYTTTGAGISVLSSTQQYLGASYSLSGLSPSTPPTLAALQNWVASSAVQSTLSQSTRTDYTYDARGQLATQTQWDMISATGTGVSDAGTVITTTTYSAQGQLLQTSTQRGSVLQTTSYAYDGLGRLISSTDPLGNVTSYVYTDSSNTLAITQANGLTTTQVRNSAGQLISSTQMATGQTSRVTSYLYNAAGQQVATIDPAGNTSYTFYNADGEVTGTVDATGAVTAYTYDADGHVIGTTQYAALISTTGWITGGALTASLPTALPLPSPSANDRTSHTLYNADGQAVATIDPEGNVTTTAYNGVGNAISTTAYATALTTAQLTALGTTPALAALQADLVSSSANRTAYTTYDADGRAVATVNAAGDVTTQTYNGAGDAVLSTAYATALTTAQLTALGSTPTLAALQADLTASSANQVTYNYYDATGRLVAQVDADGYLTTTAYNETINTTTTTRYATALTTAQLSALISNESTAILVGLLGSNTTNQQSSVTYNADNQLVSATGVDGTVTAYTYNSVGQLLTTTVTPTAGQGTARTTSATYDAFGDTLTSVDGNQTTTIYTYNVLGQRVTATDALGNITFTYYDADGRVAYTVQGQPSGSTRNALGNVTAYTYNALGQLTSTRQYASQLTLTSGSSSGATLNPTTATLAQLATSVAALPVLASDANDLTQYTYTLDGQVAGTTNGDNYQTAYAYDAFGDVTQTQQQLSGAGSALSAANSTITTYAYNALGEQTGETDGVGTAVARSTLSTYDAFGRVTSTTDGNGNVVTYGYDNLGRQVSTSQTVQGTARTTQTTYDAFARVVTQTDALGNVTAYQYNLAAHTTTVTTPDGVTMTTAKDAFGDTVSVTDGAGDITTYTYDADGRLLSTNDALGNVSTDQYDADGDLLQTTDATGHIVTYTYNASGQVLTQTVDPSSLDPGGLNLTTTYAYDGERRELSVTDPTGVVTTYAYDADGNTLTQVQDAGGTGHLNLTTTSTYDGEGKTLTVTVGAGTAAARTTQYVYDNLERLSQQIVDPGTGQLNLTTSYTYDADNNLSSVTDPKGNVTRYVYDQADEQVFRIDPTGAVTQTTYGNDGRVTLTRGYVTLLTASQLSALGSNPSITALSADLVPNGLDSYHQNVYNTEGQVAYTLDGTGLNVAQYTYDAAGQLAQTRQYATALSTSSVSSTAAPAAIAAYVTASSSDVVTTTVYNADGRAVYQINGAGDVTQTTYDAVGRVTATRAYATPLTCAQLTALGSTPTVAQIAALVVTSTSDRTTETAYNTAGQTIFNVNAAGAVTQTTYDADGRVTSTYAYATALTAAQLATLGTTPTVTQVAALVTSTSSDQISYNVYNAVGELRYTINPMGYVTETRYDPTGLVTETLAYATAVSTASETTALKQGTGLSWLSGIVGGTTGANPDSSAEATLYLYDAAGRQRFSVQQNNAGTLGVVSEQRYDADGNVVMQIAYGTALAVSTSEALSAQWTTASLSTALAGTSTAAEHVTNTVYDADSRAIYTINAANDVTQNTYDAFGHVLETQRYANAITLPSTLTAATIAAAVTAAGGATGEQYTTTTYTARGQVMTTGDALGINASYTYNGVGLKTSYTDRDGAVWNYSYNAAGLLVQEQSPAVTVGSYSGSTLVQTANQYLYTTTTYDAFGDVASVSQGSGASAGAITNLAITTYGYDAVGHQISTTTPGNTGGSTITTHVVYNALGQAVADEDGNGNWQYKAYNLGGQVSDSIDGNGYITATTYDAYGNQLTLTRYATALNTSAITAWSVGQPLSTAQVQQGLVTSGSDRTIITTYNQFNQKTQVVQPSITYSLSMGAIGGTSETGSPTTTYTYDNYGNVTSTSQLVQGAATSGSTTTPAVWATTYTYYDALNREVMVVTPTGSYTSPQGYVTTTAYNAFNAVSSTTQYAQAISTSAITTTTAPALPAAATPTTGGNRTTSYAYDAIGRVQTQTTAAIAGYTGGIVGQLSGTVGYSTASSVTGYTYNGENLVTSVTVNGAATSTTYDATGRVLTLTGPANQVLVSNWQSILESTPGYDLTSAALYTTVSPVTSYVYDALGDALSTTVSGGGQSQQTLATYNALGRMLTQTNADGTVTSSSYDNDGNITSQSYTLTGNSSSSPVTTTYTYDRDNQQLTTTVQRSGQSTYDSYTQVKYDAFGDVVAKGDGVINAYSSTGYEAIYTYNNAGQQTSAPNSTTGAMHTYAHDLVGNLVVDYSTVTGGSATIWTHNGYNLANQVIAQVTPATDASSGVDSSTPLAYTYDRWGNVISSTDANGNVTTYEYDGQNHLIEQTEAAVLVVSASGAYTRTTPTKEWYYNIDGELMGSTNENDYTSWNAYNAAGSITMTQDFTGARTTTAYDALGRAVAQETPPVDTVTGALSNITYTNYNNLNQVIGQGDFLLNSAGTARTQNAQETYVLNSNGDRIQVTDALGNTSYYNYNSQHHVLESQTPIQYVNGWAETFTYDVNGNQNSETTADGDTESWVYDYFGRVRSYVDLNADTTSYTYDGSSGLLTSEVSNWTPAGQTNPGYIPASMNGATSTVDYSYYADGQVDQQTEYTGSTAIAWDTYQYDANGNATVNNSWTEDGVGQEVLTSTTTAYDSHNRIALVTETNDLTNAVESREAYNYDAAGNRRAVFSQSAYGPSSAPITTTGSPPTAVAIATQTATPGTPWNWSVAGGFTDNLGFGLNYTATQSNGSALPSWMTLNSNGTFGGNPVTPGSWTITVTATDAIGRQVSNTFTVTVPTVAPVFTAAAPNVSETTGTAFSFTVPAATDANGEALTYTASYYNGSSWLALPSWLSFNASTRTFSGTAPAGSAGSYAIYYGAAAGGFNSVQGFTITVTTTPVPPVYNGGITQVDFYYGSTNSWTIPAGTFTDPTGGTLTYSMTGLPGTVTFSGTTLSSGVLPNIKITHTDPVVLTATDATDGLSVSVSFDLYIEGVGNGDVVEAEQPATVQAATTQTVTPQTAAVSTPDVQGSWFTYDADNRVAVNNGALVNGQIVVAAGTYNEPSYANQYDADGNVAVQVTDVSGVTMSQAMAYNVSNELVQTDYATSAGQASLGVQQTQTFDADGHLLTTVDYLNNQSQEAIYGTVDEPEGTVYLSTAGWAIQGETSTYNADGVVTSQSSLWSPSTNWVQLMNKIEQGGSVPANVTTISRLDVASTTTYTAFDHADNVTAYNFVQNPTPGATTGGFGADYTVSYIKQDGYLQQSTTGTPTVAGYVPATDTLYYNAFGQNIAVSQTSEASSGAAQNITRVFAYNTAGEILQARSGTLSGTTFTPTNGYFVNDYTYVNGQQVSDMDGEGDIGVTNTLTGFSTSASSQDYVVQADDTLASIAQAQYGNSQLGYIIAEANGLSASSTLVDGQSITIPSVTTESNTATTFKPYNPGSIVGRTTPNLPAAPPPPPPSGSGCSGLAEVVMVAVAVVATIYTAGAAAGYFATADAAAAGTADVAVAGTAASASASTFALGASVLAGGSGGLALSAGEIFTAAAIGGAVGDAAGQVIGDATGISSGFSLSQMLSAGLAAGFTAGIGGEISSGGNGFPLLANSQGGFEPAGAALFGAGAYGSSVVAAKVTGEATHFSWDGMVAAAVASGVTSATNLKGEPLQQVGQSAGSFPADVAGGLLSGGIDRETSQLLGDDHVSSWESIGEDAFGNALGNAAVAELSEPPQAQSPDEGQSTQNYINQHGGNFATAFPYSGNSSDEANNAAQQASDAAASESQSSGGGGVVDGSDSTGAGQRLTGLGTAGLVGAGGPVDPMDLVRSEYGDTFNSAIQKLGGGPQVVYAPFITSILYADQNSNGFVQPGNDAGQDSVSFTADEVHALATYIQSTGIGAGGYTSVSPQAMALLVPQDSSALSVYQSTATSMGNLVTSSDLTSVVPTSIFSNNSDGTTITGKSYAFDLTPLEDTIITRYNALLFSNPAVVQARSAWANSSDSTMVQSGPQTYETQSQFQYDSYTQTLGGVNSELKADGDLPPRIAETQAMQQMYTQIGFTLAGIPVGAALGYAASTLFEGIAVDVGVAGSVPNNIVTSGGTADAVAGANLNQVLATTEAANPLVESLQGTGQLPSNYLTKADAISQGWQPGKALGNYVSDGQIGGDVFQNSTGILPSSPGQTWYEADIGLTNTMSRSNQPGTRLLYSNDGLLYVTPDHYQTVFPIGTWK